MLFRSMKFRQKLLLVSIIPLLIISILIGTLSFNRAREAAQDSAKNNLSDAVNRVDISLTLRTRQIGKAMETLAEILALQPDSMETLCCSLLEPFQEVRSVTIFQGEEMLYTTARGKTAESTEEMYFQADMFPGKTLWNSCSEENTVLVYRGLWDAEGNLSGLLVLELDAKAFGSAVLQKQDIVKSQITLLLDENRELVYYDGFLPKGIVEGALEEYRAGRRRFDFEVGETRYYCSTQYNGIVGWISMTAAAEEMLFPGAQSLSHYIALLVAGCLGIASLLLIILSQLITKPLARLNNGMKQVIGSNFEIHLDNAGTDEIGELTESFNYMVDQVHTLINRVYREQLAQKTAEMEALQAQINPHFLYNSLDSINWMLIDRGETDISRVVVALGKLMQYSMNTQNARVPLREEYRNAKDYLLIQKNRLEEQLDYRLELEEGLEEFIVPKLILQPLIENAIKHGVLESLHCCTVTVRAFRRENWICIMVMDDGAGMSAERLESYRELLRDCPAGGNHIGIRNVARRLQLHFSDRCEFSVESAPGKGTTLFLMLPIITEE